MMAHTGITAENQILVFSFVSVLAMSTKRG